MTFKKNKNAMLPFNEKKKPKKSWWLRALSGPPEIDLTPTRDSISSPERHFTSMQSSARTSVSTGPIPQSRPFSDSDGESLLRVDTVESSVASFFTDDIRTEMLKVYVGPTNRLFYIHKDLLRRKSSYFDQVLSNYNRAPVDYMTFPTDTPESFSILIDWFYTGKLLSIHPNASPTSPASLSSPSSSPPSTHPSLVWDPLTLYLLASRFHLTPLCDIIMDAWVRLLSATRLPPTPETSRQVYSLTPIDSPPRRLLAQCIASIIVSQHRVHGFPHTERKWSIIETTKLIKSEPELLNDVTGMLKLYPFETTYEGFWALERCYFHGHMMGERCSGEGKGYAGWRF